MNVIRFHAVCGLLLLLSWAPQGRAAESARPNVLFIALDDLNDWVGFLGGHPQVRTPAMDLLANRGTSFRNAHCNAPLCNPSRTSLLTGRRPSSTGIYGLAPGFRQVHALSNLVTLPQHFAAAGYQTFGAGKIFHDGSTPPAFRQVEFQSWGDPGAVPYPPSKFVQTPDPIRAMDWGVFPKRDEEQADWKIASSAIKQLGQTGREKPFFLAVGFRSPHVPCFATQPWFDLYPADRLQLPFVLPGDRDDIPFFAWYLHWKLPEPRLSWLQRHDQWKPLVQAYLAATSFVDSQVGRVLDALKAQGLDQNTLVVLWSDHGWHLGEKGITGKNTLWERSTRVPLVFAGPGVSSGNHCEQPVELLDLYPTLIELCGLPPVEGLEGHSLFPQLKDGQAKRPWPAITTHNQGNHSVRSERWRYIRYANGSEELYDHRSDPHELTNVVAQPKWRNIRDDHFRWLPKVDAPAAPGSASRILIRKDGQWLWEGKLIDPKELED